MRPPVAHVGAAASVAVAGRSRRLLVLPASCCAGKPWLPTCAQLGKEFGAQQWKRAFLPRATLAKLTQEHYVQQGCGAVSWVFS